MTALSWKTGQSGPWTDPAAWSTGTVPGSADDVTIAVTPVFNGLPYVVTLQGSASVHSIAQSQTASTLAVSNGSLTVAGTYGLAGTLLLNGATLHAAAVNSTGGTVVTEGQSTISGAAWHGMLDIVALSPSAYYYTTTVILNNDSFTGAGGSGAGSIVLGEGVQVQDNGTALADVGVSLNNASFETTGGSLQIGSLSTISASGYCALGYDGVTLQNGGTISASGTGTSLSVTASSFSGQGTLAVSNGASVFLSGGSVTDAGVLSVGAGSYLDVHSSNAAGLFQGTDFSVQGGTLSLNASLATAQLAALAIASGTLALSGTLSNAGATLASGAGTDLANIDLAGGTITGGTIVNSGAFSVGNNAPQSNSSQNGSSAMNGVTFEGSLDIGTGALLSITNGFTLTGTGGSGTGSIAIGGGTLSVLDNETLNTSMSIGSGQAYYNAAGIYAAGTLTLGAQNVLSVLGTNISLNGTNQSGLIVNRGAIDMVSGSGSLSLYDVVNAGQIAMAAGEMTVQNVTNTGTLTDTGGRIDIGGALINAGLISVSGTAATAATIYGYYGGLTNRGLTNGGTLSISNGASVALNEYGAGWTNAGTFVIAHAELSLGGTYTVAQIGRVQASQAGTLGIGGTLLNTGVLSIGAGTNVAALGLSGVIQGGTIVDNGGGLLGQGGELSGVTFDGVLSITGTESVVRVGAGTRFLGRSGSGTGSIVVSGLYSNLTSYGDATLDHVAIALGAAVSGSSTGADSLGAASLGANGNNTLTLGADATVTQTGALASFGEYGGTLVNDGVVTAAQAGGTLSLSGTLVNAGTIAVGNGETLVLNAQSLTGTGVISVTNATADVQSATLAQLSELRIVNSAVNVTGALNATGGTLSLGAGGFAPLLTIAGTVTGGTLHDAGGGVQFAGNAILDGVTYQGTLSINRPLSTVTVVDGLTLHAPQGSGAGSLALTGAGSTLVWGSTQSLDNATFSIGSNGTSYGGHVIAAPSLVAQTTPYFGATVLLGGHLHIVQAGLYGDIGGAYDHFSSAATLTANVAHGQFLLQGAQFSNSGTIGVSGTDTLLIDSENFTNAGLMVVGAGSAVDLDLYNYFAQGSLAAQSFTNTGTLMMAGGMVMELTDNGAFPNVPLLNAAGGHIVGAGVVASRIDNAGMIEARGGVLNLVQAISGTGALQVDSGAILVLGGVGAGQTASFSGTGGVLGLQPAYFLGTVGGFASGDTIDLFNTVASSAAFSGSSIVVALSNGGTIRLATNSALTGSLSLTAGTHGDELIRFAASAGPPALPHAVATSEVPAAFGTRAEPATPIGYDTASVHAAHPM